MPLALLTVPFDPQAQAFDDGGLRRAARRFTRPEARVHLFRWQGRPWLAVLLTEADPTRVPHVGEPAPGAVEDAVPVAPDHSRRARVPSRHPPEDLDGEGVRAWERLLAWRGERARADQMPRYRVLPNRTVAELARRRPETLVDLRAVPGIGDRRLLIYGASLLEEIGASSGDLPPATIA